MPNVATDDFVAEHCREVLAARDRIAGRVRWTPLLATDLGESLRIKPENLQRTGSFKLRGAFNAILRLRERDPSVTGVCTVSSGNHAQAVAYAAAACGLRAVILIPEGANPLKVAATRALGAEVVTEGVTFDNREEFAAAYARERSLPMVHPYDDWDVIHGQGTVALEILEDCPGVEAVVTPVGGGGLLSGSALALRQLAPHVRLFGVEPELADDASNSLRTGVHQRLTTTPPTLAEGVKVLSIGERNFDVMVQRRLVDDIVTVSENELRAALVEAWHRTRLFIEPTSALPLAAWMSRKIPVSADASVVLVLTGGNVDPAVAQAILASAG